MAPKSHTSGATQSQPNVDSNLRLDQREPMSGYIRSLAILLAQFKRLPIFVAGGSVAAAGVATLSNPHSEDSSRKPLGQLLKDYRNPALSTKVADTIGLEGPRGAPHEVMGLWGKLWGAQHKALKAEGEEGRPSPLGLGLSPLQFTSADGPSLEALSNAGLTATAINKVFSRLVADPVYQFVLHTDKPALGVLKQRPLKDEATAFQDFVALGADDRSPSASSSRSTSSSGSTSSQAGSKGHASHVDQEASSARKASKAPAPASDATRLSDQEALLAFASLQGSQVQS